MRYHTILSQSLIPFLVGVLLVVFSRVLALLPLFLPDFQSELTLLSNLFLFALFPLFFALFLYAGMRAAEQGCDAVEAGLVGAFSYFAVNLVKLVLSAVLSFAALGGYLGSANVLDFENVFVSALLPQYAGAEAILLNSLCGFGLGLFGALVNFAVSGLGALLVLGRKK